MTSVVLIAPEDCPSLPKWPAVFVTGTPVTPEQAKEIIFRTDSSVRMPSLEYGIGGNDRDFRKRCGEAFGWESFGTTWDLHDAWREEMGMIDTEYVTINRLATAYVGGPYGWCHPDGTILQENQNYGKYPSVEAIAADWVRLLEAFPFINVVCTLFSAEHCEADAIPVCTITVGEGKVEVLAPSLELHQGSVPAPQEEDFGLGFVSRIMCGDYSAERGWPQPWIDEFAARSRAAVQKVLPKPTPRIKRVRRVS